MSQVLVEASVRAVLIAVAVGAILRLLKVRTAPARHRAWAAVAAAMILLPLWTAWGPRATLRVLPARAHEQVAPLQPVATVPAALPHFAGLTPATTTPAWTWREAAGFVYGLGVLMMLSRLAVGVVRARRLVRSAERRSGHLTSPFCAAPVTVGLVRPSVILPETWPQWRPEHLAAALAHEGEHALRRDPLVQFLSLVNRAIFWFHPLAWWLEHRIAVLAEEACDEAVLAQGHDRFQYSESLLHIARDVAQSGGRLAICGVTMPGAALPTRIRRILSASPAPKVTAAQLTCAAVAGLLVSAAIAAGALDREAAPVIMEQAVVQVPAPAPPPAPVAAPDAMPEPAPRPQARSTPAPSPQQNQQNHRLLAIYFDWTSIAEDDRDRALAAARKFVLNQIRPGDQIAILSSTGSVGRVDQDFTTDQDRLAETLDQIARSKPASGSGDSWAPLLASVDRLGALEGRKAIIYFGRPVMLMFSGQKEVGAYPIAPEGTDSAAQFQKLLQATARANVAFYVIDTRGLVLEPPRKQ